MNQLLNRYTDTRKKTEDICKPLMTEDYVVQPISDVSPPKWHLGHTTWFFEEMILKQFVDGYVPFDSNYGFVFNSYYETLGARTLRTDRGNLSRPSVEDVYRYRAYVDDAMLTLFAEEHDDRDKIETMTILGIHHEGQHQELLVTDIKYILGHNPLFPPYVVGQQIKHEKKQTDFIKVDAGMCHIGHSGKGFHFDNELGRHQVYLNEFSIASELVTNGEWMEFISDGGYENVHLWLSEGWEWVQNNKIIAPLYWYALTVVNRMCWGECYELTGLTEIDENSPVTHVSYYEANAFARWKGMRLPTEFEWERASGLFDWGSRWEWTESAYLPYPGYSKPDGAVGEYNGKFMVSQMVLRGASEHTPKDQVRETYRNFFHPRHRWQFTGIRLAK